MLIKYNEMEFKGTFIKYYRFDLPRKDVMRRILAAGLDIEYIDVSEYADVGMTMVGGMYPVEDFLAEFDHLTTYGDKFNFHLASGNTIMVNSYHEYCALIAKNEALELSDLVDL